jgi:hypothetical protein
VYKVSDQLQATQSVYVLNFSPCPAVLLECGFITNQRDREFITKGANQELIARKILAAIEAFAVNQNSSGFSIGNKENGAVSTSDPTPRITIVAVDTSKEKIFTTVDKKASVNQEKWTKFLSDTLGVAIRQIAKSAPPGTYTVNVTFVVEKNGAINLIHALNDPGYGIGKKVESIMKNSPRWEPARVKGKPVRAYYTQPVTFVISDEVSDIPKKDGTPLPLLNIEKIQSMPVAQLINAEEKDEIVSFVFSTDNDYGDIVEFKNLGSRYSDFVKKYMEREFKPGRILYIEDIIVKRNGVETNLQGKVYKLL